MHFRARKYLSLGNVPDDNIIHVVSVNIVIQRGFALPGIYTGEPVSSFSGLRKATVDQGNKLAPFRRGYICGLSA
jgi:hypothetical protein